jgi:YbbR domain-containing protein
LSNVQLNFRLPNDVEISNKPPDKIDVVLTGTKDSLDRLNSRNLIAFVDVSGYQVGRHTVRLMRDTVSMDLPEGVHVNSVDPNIVALQLEQRETRELPVEIQFDGRLPEGYELRRSSTTPNKVSVRGPASSVRSLTTASTERVSLTGLTTTTTIPQVSVELNNDKVVVSDPIISVTLEVGEKRVEKSFSNVFVRESTGAATRPSVAAVILLGPQSLLDKLNSQDLQLVLDMASDGSITQRIVLPAGMENQVELRSTNPSGFTVIK